MMVLLMTAISCFNSSLHVCQPTQWVALLLRSRRVASSTAFHHSFSSSSFWKQNSYKHCQQRRFFSSTPKTFEASTSTKKPESPAISNTRKEELQQYSKGIEKLISDKSPKYNISGITKKQIHEAQAAWGEGIVKIASTYTAGGDYLSVAADHVETLYAYGLTQVLFKPTLVAEQQFRSTFDDALSYFVATGKVEEDSGFAIKGWTAVRFENVDVLTEGDVGQAMGNYFFTNPDGDEVKVEYSFGYILDEHGKVRINLHHSSLPYTPSAAITKEQIEEAQVAWGEGIVKIASTHTAGGDYVDVAKEHVDRLYAYDIAPVLFKPTLVTDQQFRSTFQDALSYFVATGVVTEDSGFAIKGWTAVRFENADIITEGKIGMAMGNYFFTNPDGDEVKVEYSFGYILDESGDVRIHLHHSSMPYDPSS